MNSHFKEPNNPTNAELENWAHDSDALQPGQDWDLMIATPERIPLFLKLVADPMCKKRIVFVECLRAVSSNYNLSKDQKALVEFIKTLRKTHDNSLILIADDLEKKIIDYEIIIKPLKEHDRRKEQDRRKLWFRAKRYGWGWSPCTWQGWLVLLIAVPAYVSVFRNIDSASHSVSDTLIGIVLPFLLITVALIFVCYKTGEKPRWRWGGE